MLVYQRVPHPMTDPNGAAIYGVPWIPSIYPSHVSIYSSTMDPMGMNWSKKNGVKRWHVSEWVEKSFSEVS